MTTFPLPRSARRRNVWSMYFPAGQFFPQVARQVSTIPVQWLAIVLQPPLIGHQDTPRAFPAMLATVDGPKPQPVAFVAPEPLQGIAARPLA
jgi:hypothetical protein